jgi:nucleotide-binding universal stress UspA family protein
VIKGGSRHEQGDCGAHHPRVVLFFKGAEQRGASAKLVRDAFWAAAGGQPRDVAVTVRTPEGDPGAALTSIATRHGDVIVVGRENLPGWRRVRHGSVSRYCRSHAGCPVVVVPIDQESL